jgi:histidine ammonia-lyase
MAVAQAFDFLAPMKPSPACRAAYDAIRQCVPKLEEDRPLHNDINALVKVVKEGKVLDAAEGIVGKLD